MKIDYFLQVWSFFSRWSLQDKLFYPQTYIQTYETLQKSGLLEIFGWVRSHKPLRKSANQWVRLGQSPFVFFVILSKIPNVIQTVKRIYLPKPNMCGVHKRCSQRPVIESCSFSCKQSDRSLLCIVWKYAEIILNLLL